VSKCDQRTYAFADVVLAIDITVDGKRTSQPRLAFPRISLRDPGAPPPNLKSAGGVSKTTQPNRSSGRAELHGLFPLGASVSGSIDSQVTLRISPNFYCDCDGPYCLKGKLHDIKLHLTFEDPTHTFHPRFCDIDHSFETLSWDGGCKPPDWRLCCQENDVELELKLDRFAVTNSMELTISGSARMDYEVWYRATGSSTEASTATYGKAGTNSDGSMKFALKSSSVNVSVQVPASLGGGQVSITEATGFATVALGDTRGTSRELIVRELDLTAPAVKLPDGRSTGQNHVTLAPGSLSLGYIDIGSGVLALELHETITNDLFSPENPIVVNSQVVGVYDWNTDEARIVGLAHDQVPSLDQPQRPRK